MKKTDRDESAVPRACCDTVNRGGSYADGKFVFDTLDGFVIALDGQTGQEVWVVKHAFPEKGETITSAPLIADDKVLISFGGSEFAARDNKWTLSMFARKVETGEAVWVYQMTPFDQWDYDGINENIITTMEIDGKKRKALDPLRPQWFAYVVDAADGTLLRATKYVTTDWAEKVDMKTGRPIKVREHSPLERWPQRLCLPVCHGRQGPAAGFSRSQGAEHLLYADQQLVHGAGAPGAHAHEPGHGLRVRERVHVSPRSPAPPARS